MQLRTSDVCPELPSRKLRTSGPDVVSVRSDVTSGRCPESSLPPPVLTSLKMKQMIWGSLEVTRKAGSALRSALQFALRKAPGCFEGCATICVDRTKKPHEKHRSRSTAPAWPYDLHWFDAVRSALQCALQWTLLRVQGNSRGPVHPWMRARRAAAFSPTACPGLATRPLHP